MGVDIALGLVVLMGAVRGFLRGFVLQAVRLGGAVACVFLADPIRDFARPHLQPQFPSIRPELLDRLTWWTAAAVSFVVLTGVAGMIYRGSRRRALGEPEPNYTDQGAGLVLGLAKGLVVASVLALLFDKYAIGHLKNVPWLDEQARGSQSLVWSQRYKPALQIWESAPVQSYVAHVRRNGLFNEGVPSVSEVLPAAIEATTQSQSPTPPRDRQAQAPAPPALRLDRPHAAAAAEPARPTPQPGTPDFLREFEDALRREGIPPKSR